LLLFLILFFTIFNVKKIKAFYVAVICIFIDIKIRIIFNNNNNKALEIERKGNKIKQNINRRTVVNSVCKSIAFVYIYLSFQTISNTGK